MYELEDLLGSLEDPELDYYLLTKNKLNNESIDFVINLNDFAEISKQLTLQDILSRFINFVSATGKKSPQYTRMRNNLEKVFLYDDEVYHLTINFENQILFSGELNELVWRAFEKKTLLSRISNWSLLNKINLRYGYLRINLRLISEEGNTRKIHEQQECMLDTESYTKKLFYEKIINVSKMNHKNLNQKGFLKIHTRNIFDERAKLWPIKINWDKPESIPFNDFQVKSVVEYWEVGCLFFELKYNHKLLEKGKSQSYGYNHIMRYNYECLKQNQPIFLKYEGYKHRVSLIQRIIGWITVLKS